jgi:hypothetical protein
MRKNKIDMNCQPWPVPFPAGAVVKCGKRVRSYPTLLSALDSLRPWVGFDQAIRVFENFFLLQ